jgi:hypothetical protein
MISWAAACATGADALTPWEACAMDEIPLLGRDDDRRLFTQFASQYGPPAFVRRAVQVQEAFEQLVLRCHRQRDEWLAMARTQLGILQSLAGDWSALRSLLTDDNQVEILRRLGTALNPCPRVPLEPTHATGKLRQALREVVESLERFNRRWEAFLPTVDLNHVNELRDGYNRYYVLEKECLVRSPRLARQGFTRLEPLTVTDLSAVLPLFPVPQLRD